MPKLPVIIGSISDSNVLPNRSLLKIDTRTILQFMAAQIKRARSTGDIFFSTTTRPCDDGLAAHAQDIGLHVIRGNKRDIISRLILAYERIDCRDAVVLRGDVPLLDIGLLDVLVEEHLRRDAQYSYSDHMTGLPYGMGGEVISRSALEHMIQFDPTYVLNKQDLSIHLRLRSSELRIFQLDFEHPRPDLRLVVENQRDLERIRQIVRLIGDSPSAQAICKLLEEHPFLAESDPRATAEIGLEKILLFPRKIEAFLGEAPDSTYPVSVELSLTGNCNLNCKWCSDAKLRKMKAGSLDIEIYRSLIEDLAAHGTRGVVLEGGGEPTTHPDFNKAVKLAKDSGLSVGLITNGVEFAYEELVPEFEWIRVSLDSDTPEHYLRDKGKDHFYNVLANIRRMAEVKQSCVIGVGYVATNENLDRLEDIVLLLQSYKVDYIYIRPVIDAENLAPSLDLDFLKKYESQSFSVMIHGMRENVITGNNSLPCRSHSLSTVINGDGSVFICGRLNIHDWWEPIGNLNESSFNAIWNGTKRGGQIELLRQAEFCSTWCPQCRLTKYNALIDRIKNIRTSNFI